MSKNKKRDELDNRIYVTLTYANAHPDMKAYKKGIESEADFNEVVDKLAEIDGGFEIDVSSLKFGVWKLY